MKKVFQINVTKNGSTGKIMQQIDTLASKKYITKYYYGRGEGKNFFEKLEVYFSVFLTRVFSKHGYGCYYNTKKLIKELDDFKPDLIQIHNIHGYYINIKMLFNYLKKLNVPIVWTLHDCFSYTGHCAYYTKENCYKWQKQCYSCPQLKEYPKSLFFDTSKTEFKKKKDLFTKLKNMTLVVPSNWLSKEVKKSFMGKYEIEVIHNAIDLNVFKPIKDDSIREKYNIGNSKIILGVANVWDERKGLNRFLELAQVVDKNIKIVLVGLNDKQIASLPKNIIGIKRTENILELVKLYSVADVFYNPSLEETFSLVTVEALACGTPCLVFNSTATPELITEKVGIVISDYNVNNVYKNIQKIINGDYYKECVKRASLYKLDNYYKYVELYDRILGD